MWRSCAWPMVFWSLGPLWFQQRLKIKTLKSQLELRSFDWTGAGFFLLAVIFSSVVKYDISGEVWENFSEIWQPTLDTKSRDFQPGDWFVPFLLASTCKIQTGISGRYVGTVQRKDLAPYRCDERVGSGGLHPTGKSTERRRFLFVGFSTISSK